MPPAVVQGPKLPAAERAVEETALAPAEATACVAGRAAAETDAAEGGASGADWMAAVAVDGAEPHEADEAAATAGAPDMASGGVRVRDPILAVGVLSEGPNGPFASRLTSEEQPARKRQ